MKNSRIFLIFTILSILLYSNQLNGQNNCILDFQFPNGLHDVSLNPIAGFTASCSIDTTKLVKRVYDYQDVEYDTLNNRLTKSVVYFVEKDTYVHNNDSSFNYALTNYSTLGLFEPVNNYTLNVFPVTPLKNNTDYEIYIGSLYFYGGITEIVIDTLFNDAFKTIDKLHIVSDVSFLNTGKLVKCNDEIFVTFSKKLNSAIVNNQNLLTLREINGKQQIDSLYHKNNLSNEIASNCLLSDDSLSVIIESDSLDIGKRYILEIHLNELTGSPNDFTTIDFMTNDLAIFTSEIIFPDTSYTIPDSISTTLGNEEAFLVAGETLHIAAPLYIGDKQFKKWECETLPFIQDSIGNFLNFDISCEHSGYHNIKAIYGEPLIDTLIFSSNLFTNGDIKVEGFLDSLGNGVYTAERKIDTKIYIAPVPDSLYTFDGWDFDFVENPEFEENGEMLIMSNYIFDNSTAKLFDELGKPIEFDGDFGPIQGNPCSTIELCINFWPSNYHENLNDIVDLYLDGVKYELYEGQKCINLTSPFPNSIELKLNIDPCYNVDRMWENYNGFFPVFKDYQDDELVYDIELDENARNCKHEVNIGLEQIQFELLTEIALTTESYLSSAVNILHYSGGFRMDGITRFHTNWERIHGVLPFGSYNTVKFKNKFKCPCGNVVHIFPDNKAGFEEYHNGFYQEATTEMPDLVDEPVSPTKEIGGVERENVLTITMDSDKHIFYKFMPDFKIDFITYQKPRVIEDNITTETAVESYIPYDDIKSLSPEGSNFLKIVGMSMQGNGSYDDFSTLTPKTTQIGLIFNKALDPSTINGNTFYAEDLTYHYVKNNSQERLDGKNLTKYEFDESKNGSYTFGDSKVLLKLSDMRNSSNYLDIPHMSEFKVYIGLGDIRSFDGENLNTYYGTFFDFALRTEYPSLIAKTNKASFFEYWGRKQYDSFYALFWASAGKSNDIKDASYINYQYGLKFPLDADYETKQFMAREIWHDFLDCWLPPNYDTPQYHEYININRLSFNDYFTTAGVIANVANDPNIQGFNELNLEILSALQLIVAPEWEMAQTLFSVLNEIIDTGGETHNIIYKSDFVGPSNETQLWGLDYLYQENDIEIIEYYYGEDEPTPEEKMSIKYYLIHNN